MLVPTGSKVIKPLVLSEVADEVRRLSDSAQVISFLDADTRLTGPILTKLADELNISVPASVKAQPSAGKQPHDGRAAPDALLYGQLAALNALIEDIRRTGHQGIGKPEQLLRAGRWCRAASGSRNVRGPSRDACSGSIVGRTRRRANHASSSPEIPARSEAPQHRPRRQTARVFQP